MNAMSKKNWSEYTDDEKEVLRQKVIKLQY